MRTRQVLVLIVCAVALAASPSRGQEDSTECSSSIGDVVSSLGANYTTLATMLQQAGLYDELTNTSYTLFAPNNAALAQGLVELNVSVAMLSRPLMNAALQAILSYHVVTDYYPSLGSDLADPEANEVDMSDNLILSQYAYLAAFPVEDSFDGMFSLVSDNDALLVMSEPAYSNEECSVVVYELLDGLVVPRQAFGELGAWGSTVAG